MDNYKSYKLCALSKIPNDRLTAPPQQKNKQRPRAREASS